MKGKGFKRWQKVLAVVLIALVLVGASPLGRAVYAATASALGVWQTSNQFVITENGTYTVYAKDAVGNVSQGYTFTVSNIDNAEPTLSVGYSTTDWTKDTVSLVIDSVDQASPGGSAGTVTVSVKGSDGTVYALDHQFTANTSGTVTSTDDVGNSVSKPFSITWIDTTEPDGKITADITAPTNTDVVLTISGTDTQSGLPTDSFSWDNVTWSSNPSKTFESNGTYVGYLRDSVGNIDTIQYEVTNIDKQNPVINGFSFSTENPINTEVVVTADAVDLGLGLDTSAYNFNNEGWQSSANYTVTANGTYTLVVRDKAGNTSESSFVVSNLDFEKPVITWCTPSTIEPTNQDVTFNVGATDNEGGLGLSDKPYRINGVCEWQASNDLVVTQNGTYTIEVTDAAGNIASVSREVTNIDKTLPAITASVDTTEPVNRDVVLELTVSDNVEILKVLDTNGNVLSNGIGSVSDKVYTLDIAENGTYVYTVIDTALNESEVTVVVSNIDKILPTVDDIRLNPSDPINTEVEVTVMASDEGIGLDDKPYSFDGGAWQSSNVIIIDENGSYEVVVRDKAGNEIHETYRVDNLDFEKPVISSVVPSTTRQTNEDVILEVNANDIGLGLERDAYRLDGGSWQSSNRFSVSANGVYSVEVIDDAGNIQGYEVVVSNIDKILPDVSHVVDIQPDVPTKSDVVITLVAEDNVEIESITLPDGVVKTIGQNNSTLDFTATISGNYTFLVKDTAGNVTEYVVNVPNIDKNPADISVTQSITDWTTSNHTITVTFTDDFLLRKVFVDGEWFDLDNGELPDGATINEVNGEIRSLSVTRDVSDNGSHTFKAVDYSENESSKTFTISNFDRVDPKLDLSLSPSGDTNGNVTIKGTATDEYGEIKGITLPNGEFVEGTTCEYSVSGNGTYKFIVVDMAGNEVEVSKTVSNIDKTDPTVSFDLSVGSDEWTSESIIITVTAEDSHNDFTFTLIKDGVSQTNKTGIFEISENGTYTLEVTDGVGNKHSETIVIENIDKDAPTISVSLKNEYWVNNSNTLVVRSVDGLSGVAGFSLDGENWQTSGEFDVTYADEFTVYVKDKAGNISKVTVSFDLVEEPVNEVVEDTSGGDDNFEDSDENVDDSTMAKTDTLVDGGLDIMADMVDVPVSAVRGVSGMDMVIETVEAVVEVAVKVAPFAGIALFLTLGVFAVILLTDGVRVYGKDSKGGWKYLGIARCKSSLSGYTVTIKGKVLKMVDGCDFKLVFNNKYSTTHKGASVDIKIGNQTVQGNIYKNVEFSITR